MQIVSEERTYTELIDRLGVEDGNTIHGVIREFCRQDLYFLTKFVLGWDRLEYDVHKPVCDFLEGIEKAVANEHVFYDPRKYFKSTIMSAYLFFRIIRDPFIRILLASQTVTSAQRFMIPVSRYFTNNQNIRALYPELVPDLQSAYYKNVRWNLNEIEIIKPNIADSIYRKEATITCCGADTAVTGGAYDLVYTDDLVTLVNCNTPGQLEHIDNFYNELLMLRDRYVEDSEVKIRDIITVGTRWKREDLGNRLSNDKNVRKFIRPALDEMDNSTFPNQHPVNILHEMQAKNPYLFSCIMQNNPVAQEQAIFKRDWFRYKNSYDELPDNLTLTIACDPAVTEKQADNNPDNTAIGVMGLDLHNNLYLMDVVYGQWHPDKVIAELFSFILGWRGWFKQRKHILCAEFPQVFNKSRLDSDVIKWEKINLLCKEKNWKYKKTGIEKQRSEVLLADIQKITRQYFIPVNFEQLKSRQRVREMKANVMALQPYIQNQSFYVMSWMTDVVDEFCNFPHSIHDDIADMCGMHLQMIIPHTGSTKSRFADIDFMGGYRGITGYGV